jgi:hypothetical protein
MHTRDGTPYAGHPMWSAAGGAAVGAAAGLFVLALVDWRIEPARFADHLRGLFSEGSRLAVWTIVATALGGALLGGSFGRLTRRLFPLVPRILEGAVLVPALCIVVYAFGLRRFAPHVAQSVPFLWSLLGAIVFGVCVALVPPIRPRRVRLGPRQ